ncbi:MAG: hypothetical protein AUJ07_05090 [Crenarchaeota archaeon 13_1_40CM_3_53_5]|nr:MAG: hypothetical protein AUJ07_05090 [Crenarchaeota archaeon 13_1_40CM_3_53_5]
MGLGKAFAFALAKEGATVAVADLDVVNARAVVEGINKEVGAKAAAFLMDVSDDASVHKAMSEIASTFGGIDILINNAALSDTVLQKRAFTDIPLEEWDRVMAVNVKGPWLTIINIISTLAYKGSPGFLQYATSKAALIGLTRTLAHELGEHNININMIGPGLTATDRIRRIYDEKMLQNVASRRALKRIETSEDLIGALIFLSSSESDFITGQTILVNGGDIFL